MPRVFFTLLLLQVCLLSLQDTILSIRLFRIALFICLTLSLLAVCLRVVILIHKHSLPEVYFFCFLARCGFFRMVEPWGLAMQNLLLVLGGFLDSDKESRHCLSPFGRGLLSGWFLLASAKSAHCF